MRRSIANPLLFCAFASVMLWPLEAAAQLNSNSFSPVSWYSTGGNYTYAVAVGDLNNDGFADIVVSNQCYDGVCGGGPTADRHTAVQVLINNGDGTFHVASRKATDNFGGTRQSVAIADVDGDGKPDVIVQNGILSQDGNIASSTISVLRGNGDGTLQDAVSYPLNLSVDISVFADKLTVVDVNGDGKLDILVSVSVSYPSRPYPDYSRGGVSVLLNHGDGTFAGAVLYDSGGYSGAPDITSADVNHDGHPDILVLNNCSTAAASPANGSQCMDTNSEHMPGTVGVLLGNGNGTFQQAVTYLSGGYGPLSLAAVDLNRDGNLDLLVANSCSNVYCNSGISGGKASVLLGNANGSFQTPVNYDDNALQPVSVAAADVDGDGAADAVVLNNCAAGQSCDGTTQTFSYLAGVGDGTLQQPPALNPQGSFEHTSPSALVLADVNNDGKPDLVFIDWNSLGVLLNQTPRAATATGLASQPNPSGAGQTATLTATVTSSAPGVPTGSVTFREGAAVLGTAPLVNAVAALGVSNLAVGSHRIVASYSSDTAFRASDSEPLTQVVQATSLAVNPAAVIGGASSTGTVTLPGAAPAGGTVVTLSSSDTSAATVPASVTVAAGTTTKTFTVTSKPVAAQASVTISASSGGQTATAILTVNPAALASLTVSPASVIGGGKPKGTVTLNGKAPGIGAVVTLSSGDPSATVPASVKIASGAASATFTVTTTPVASTTGPFNISASYHSATLTAPLTVLEATAAKVTVSPASVVGGVSSKGTVTLTGAAPAAGATVVLGSANPAASVPGSVLVPAGSISTTFTITTIPVATTQGPFLIDAAYNGVTVSDSLTVQAATLSKIVVTPSSVTGGTPASGTVTLTGNAPPGDAVVTLTSANAAAGVLATVTVIAGTSTATFPITTTPVAASTSPFNISAAYNGVTKNDTLTVKAPAVLSLVLNPPTVVGGGHATGTVTLTGPAPTGGFAVALKSSNTAVAIVLPSVTVLATNTSTTFDISTVPVAGASTATISATAGGTTKNAALAVTP